MRACNQCERFFFILRGHGWFVSAWHSDASIRTPPNHVNTVCDLLAKSLTTPKSPPAFLPSPPSRSTFLHRYTFSRSSVFSKRHLSLTLSFSRLAMHSPSRLSLSLFQIHTCAQRHTHTHTHYCTFSHDGVTHSTALTSLTLGGHCQWVVHGLFGCICVCMFIQMWVWDHGLCLRIQVAGLGFLMNFKGKPLWHEVSVSVAKIFLQRPLKAESSYDRRWEAEKCFMFLGWLVKCITDVVMPSFSAFLG